MPADLTCTLLLVLVLMPGSMGGQLSCRVRTTSWSSIPATRQLSRMPIQQTNYRGQWKDDICASTVCDCDSCITLSCVDMLECVCVCTCGHWDGNVLKAECAACVCVCVCVCVCARVHVCCWRHGGHEVTWKYSSFGGLENWHNSSWSINWKLFFQHAVKL